MFTVVTAHWPIVTCGEEGREDTHKGLDGSLNLERLLDTLTAQAKDLVKGGWSVVSPLRPCGPGCRWEVTHVSGIMILVTMILAALHRAPLHVPGTV